MHWKKSLLVIHKILRLFANTLIVDDKHCLLNRDNLTQPIQIQLSEKQKTFSEFFFSILKICFKFQTFDKKIWSLQLMYFRKYRLRKIWLDKCLKSPVSEDPQIDNKRSGSKHSCNLNDRTFTIFINHCEGSCIGKSLFQ